MKEQEKNILHEPQPDYEKAEIDQLKRALNRSYTERFLVMTRLMKRGIMIRNATIIRKPYEPLK